MDFVLVFLINFNSLQANNMGVGVVGIIECNFLKPTHNKQDFDYTNEYRYFYLHFLAHITISWEILDKAASLNRKNKSFWCSGQTWFKCKQLFLDPFLSVPFVFFLFLINIFPQYPHQPCFLIFPWILFCGCSWGVIFHVPNSAFNVDFNVEISGIKRWWCWTISCVAPVPGQRGRNWECPWQGIVSTCWGFWNTSHAREVSSIPWVWFVCQHPRKSGNLVPNQSVQKI